MKNLCRYFFILQMLLFTAHAAELDGIADEICSTPSWGGIDKDELKARSRQIADHLNKFTYLSTNQARKAIQIALESSKSSNSHAKTISILYLANRIYFKIPNSIKIKDVKSFGGLYIDTHVKSENRPVIWPLTFAEDGKYTLDSSFNIYSGPTYDVLAEFDYFANRFERRYK